MLACMQDCVYALRPAYIFINIGTNDLNDPACTPDVLHNRYRTCLLYTSSPSLPSPFFSKLAHRDTIFCINHATKRSPFALIHACGIFCNLLFT